MPSQYSTKVKAEVIEMARQGETSVQIGQETGLPRSTITDWLKAARDLAKAEDRDPRLVDREYRLTFMGQELQEVQLAELQAKVDAGESILQYMVPLNILKGTSYDKVQKQPGTIQTQNIQINFVTEKRE